MTSFLKTKVTGFKELRNKLRNMPKELEAEMRKVVEAGAMLVRNDAIKSIQDGKKTGRVYKRGNIEHRASAPGEAPASDTGRLVAAITYDMDDRKPIAYVRAATEYAKRLEFGTVEVAARPFLLPAVKKNEKKIEAAYKRKAKEYFKSKGKK